MGRPPRTGGGVCMQHVWVVEEGSRADAYLVRPDIRAVVLRGVWRSRRAAVQYAAGHAADLWGKGSGNAQAGYWSHGDRYVGVRSEQVR